MLKIIAVSILCVLCITISGQAQSNERDALSRGSSGSDIDITRLEMKIHDLVNKERTKKGLSALSWDEKLCRTARKYSGAMAKRNFFSHSDPEGRSFYDRYKAEGINCRIRSGDSICLGAENIAQDNLHSSYSYIGGERSFNWKTEDQIAESVVRRWMSSNGHRANILTPYFKKQGIGVAFSDEGKVYVTENFC